MPTTLASMTVQRPDLPGIDPVVPCGQAALDGWFSLPAGWSLGRPVPVAVVRDAEEAWRDARPEPDGASPAVLLLLGVAVAGLLGTGFRVWRRRRGIRELPGPAAAPPEARDEAGDGDQAGDGDANEAGEEPGARRRSGEASAAAKKSPAPGDDRAGPGPIVVQLRRPMPRPDAVPVRLPPHIAAHLARTPPDAGGPSGADPARSDDGAVEPDGQPSPGATPGDPAGDPPAPGSRARRIRLGRSWLIED